AWKAKVTDLKDAMAKATDRPAEVNESLDWADFAKDFRATTQAKRSGQPFDYSVFRPRFAAHVKKYPELPNIGARAADYLGALESMMPGTSLEEWKLQLDAPNASLREKAKERVMF